MVESHCRPPGVPEEMEAGPSRQGSDMWQRSIGAGQAPDPKRKGRFQIVEDDIVDKQRPSRNVSSASLEKVSMVRHQLAGMHLVKIVRFLWSGMYCSILVVLDNAWGAPLSLSGPCMADQLPDMSPVHPRFSSTGALCRFSPAFEHSEGYLSRQALLEEILRRFHAECLHTSQFL